MKFRSSDEKIEVYETWILEALEELGGRAEKLDVMKEICVKENQDMNDYHHFYWKERLGYVIIFLF